MNATKEHLAFNVFWNSMDEHEGMDTEICENVFKDGYNTGRKQALEEAIAICEKFLSGGSNGIQAARVCAYNIKELLK